jgi:glucosamine-6-phosphate deaminase
MKLIISNSVEKLNIHCSEIIADMIKINPELKLGLATGNTPIGIYRSLVSLFKNGKINFNDVRMQIHLDVKNGKPITYLGNLMRTAIHFIYYK